MIQVLRLLSLITFLLGALSARAERFELGRLQGNIPAANSFVKVAFFDADLTLRHSATPGLFSPSSPQDQIIYDGVAEQLRHLNESGYIVAVISNQGKVTTAKDWENQRLIFESLRNHLAAQGAFIHYIQIDGATHPENRKPRLGLYHHLEALLAQRGLKLDSLSSFFVGDGGFTRNEEPALPELEIPRDHGNADREFARNAGLPFFHAAEFFGRREAKLPAMDISWLRLQIWLSQQQQEFAQLESHLDKNDTRGSIDKIQRAQDRFLLETTVQVGQELEALILSHSNSRQWEQIRPLLQNLKKDQAAGDKGAVFKSFQRLLDQTGVSALPQKNHFARWLGLCRRWWEQALEFVQSRRIARSLTTNSDYILGQKRFSKTVQDLQDKKWLPRLQRAELCSQAFL